MRGGKLLAENSPDELLMMYQVPRLEDVVLKLSRRDEKSPSDFISTDARPKSELYEDDGIVGLKYEAIELPKMHETKGIEAKHQVNNKMSIDTGKAFNYYRKEDTMFSLHRLKALFIKNILVLVRNIG